MERDINLDEISDGKLYDANDMVKVGCSDCAGCSACCHGMGETIVLDPYDIWQLTSHLGCTFEQLLSSGRIALHVYEGLILPSLNLVGEEEGCPFLNKEGRCSIHSFRPGICRCFPLGRLYENGSFRYFLQIHECRKENRTKMKIRKWLEIHLRLAFLHKSPSGASKNLQRRRKAEGTEHAGASGLLPDTLRAGNGFL